MNARPKLELGARVVLVGIAPSGARDDLPAFDPRARSGAFLAEILGRPAPEVFETRNVLPDASLPARGIVAHRLGVALREELAALRRPVIVCGRDAAYLLHVADNPMLTWRREVMLWVPDPVAPSRNRPIHAPLDVATFPHPSGRNRWWNDPEARKLAAEWLREQARV